ncbi:HlyD family secretion protein [Marinomonas mediterranea]|jgi:Multidrug resistance efflux pump|uniref:Secretion protein HlyD family protein n=1 Tax=Marinomonas mediterranea (strain ATCC 700492 / JCM 21426 / NBRC 103028 / MMB-1) TaxID=717774 RepID=F2JW85_MARM1|nr:HlyD family secretion protein [Marinomonas mediterranea]ADZ89473.1 secretion protein HlyD family protein [Marinomonas mediterranea MMB-1]
MSKVQPLEAQSEAATEMASSHERGTPVSSSSWKRKGLLFGVPLLAVLLASAVYLMSGRYVETENAYVQANITPITTQISGKVQQLAVKENQVVKKGALLFSLDAKTYQVAVKKAEAQLQQVKIDLRSEKAAYDEKLAEVTLAKSRFEFNKRDQMRQENLRNQHFISDAQLDSSAQATTVSQLKIQTLQKDLRRLREALGGDIKQPIELHPTYLAAKAVLEQARLNVERANVTAPADGVVSKLPKVGEYLAPGSTAMVLVGNKNLWVEANYTEKDLTFVQPGQDVEIKVDTYPGVTWKGTVDSISPATGSEFSVIPAENATGNWVKVAQRLPVRIHIKPQNGLPQLRAGMSSEVSIDTQHQRQLFGATL